MVYSAPSRGHREDRLSLCIKEHMLWLEGNQIIPDAAQHCGVRDMMKDMVKDG